MAVPSAKRTIDSSPPLQWWVQVKMSFLSPQSGRQSSQNQLVREPERGSSPTEREGSYTGVLMSTAFKPQIDSSADSQLPNSRRIYVEGQQPGVRVPFREVD